MQGRSSKFLLFGLLLSLAALLALSASCPTTKANTSAALLRQPTTLRVIAFNAHLLPAVAVTIAGRRSQGDYRSRAIGRRIDYCFVSAPSGASSSLRPMRVNVERFLDSQVAGGSLSDHAAVECELSLVVRRAPVESATGGGDVPPRSK